MWHSFRSAFCVFIGFSVFFGVELLQGGRRAVVEQPVINERVVVSAPLLVFFYAGDRFLAANMEVFRFSAMGFSADQHGIAYLARSQVVVSELNACHEDNYYLSNGLLAWGGAVDDGARVLESAVYCRSWDYVPPFFYGLNLSFFKKDVRRSKYFLELSARRSQANSIALRRLAIMLRAEAFSDEKMALEYLKRQYASVKESALRSQLEKRITRLQGLVILRDAQRNFQEKYGRLQSLKQLVEFGFIPALPDDPLKIGYELDGGVISLGRLRVSGGEHLP